ncbi:MAG: carboxypeptidase regulatory-like domain-containing protein [Calditrichaeota bacterium]|nr:MAG: carboxypeptidase regulatory-like domain-containing protein [Calditrichota bacterium]
MGTLIGKVYQQSRGLTYYIPDAKVNVDGYVTYSDSTGRFEIEVPKGEHSITCGKQPFDTTFISKVTVNDYRAYNLLMTGPTFSVAGTVTDTSGNKIEGAVALLEHLRDTSDTDGYFFFDSIPTGFWELQVMKDDYYFITESLEINFANNISLIQLTQKYFTVSGVVYDTLGSPIESVLVELGNIYAYTNSLGKYELHPIENGEHEIRAELADYYILVDSVEVNGSDTQSNLFIVRKSYSVSGTVAHQVDGFLSDIEVVLDSSLYDTTDNNGNFSFEYIFSGDHQLEFSSNVYNNEIQWFSIEFNNYETSIIMKKNYIDTLWIENDASVRYVRRIDSTSNYTSDDENLGNREYLEIEKYYFQDFWNNNFTIIETTQQIFMQLPEVDYSGVDSAMIIINASWFYYDDRFSILITEVLESWDENSITWANQPNVTSENLLVNPEINVDSEWVINLSENSQYFDSPHGIMLRATSCYGVCSNVLVVASSESSIENRPHILVYRSE